MSKRKAYIEKMTAQLKLWNAEIDVLRAKAEKKKADVKIEYYDSIKKLQDRSQAAQKRLKELQEAGEDGWEDLKQGLENSWKELKSTLDRVSAKLK